LTSATMTGVMAVAITVPACQSRETTVAAIAEEIAATSRVPTLTPLRPAAAKLA
jgi:hypothetical protein